MDSLKGDQRLTAYCRCVATKAEFVAFSSHRRDRTKERSKDTANDKRCIFFYFFARRGKVSDIKCNESELARLV